MSRGLPRAFLPLALLLPVAAATGCVVDPWTEPVAGREVTVRLPAGAPRVTANWPASWRRAAIFEIVNGTGVPLESVEIDMTAPGAPREIVRATVMDREGVPVRFLYAPHGQLPLRVLVGGPGTTLLLPGESVVVRLDVLGDAGAALLVFSAPGVTPP